MRRSPERGENEEKFASIAETGIVGGDRDARSELDDASPLFTTKQKIFS